MLSPRTTAFLAAALMFCGTDIALGFFCGETFSSDLDGWGIVRVIAVLMLCSATAIWGYGYVTRTVPPVKPAWAIFTLISLLSLVCAIEVAAMWLQHFDRERGGMLCLPYHGIEFVKSEIRIFSSTKNCTPDNWRWPYSPTSNISVTTVPDWIAMPCLLALPTAWILIRKLRDRSPINRKARHVCAACGYYLPLTANHCPDCGSLTPIPETAAKPPARIWPTTMTLGGKLSIIHSLFWLYWIMVVFDPGARQSMNSIEPILLIFPLGCVALPAVGTNSSFPVAVALFVTGCANSFLVGYGLARLYQTFPWNIYIRSPAERRHAAGLCTYCGYSLRGNVSGRCPECGARCAYKVTDEIK